MASTRKRIMIVLDALLVGGTETHALSLAQELIRQGAHVTICAKTGPLKSDFEGIGCSVHSVALSRPNIGKLAITRKLIQVAKSERINVIHSHQPRSSKFAYVAAKSLGIPLIVTVHGKYEDIRFAKKIHQYGAKFVSVSHPLRSWLSYHGIPSKLIPNGVSLTQYVNRGYDKALLRAEYQIPQTAKVVVYASRLSNEKASICNRVIHACMKIRMQSNIPIYLVIAGGGVHAQSVQNHTNMANQNAEVPFIRMLGIKKRMHRIYAMADCVVGTGRVAIEAMACGKPVVAIGASGLFGLLRPGKLDSAWKYYYGDHKFLYPWSSEILEHGLQTILTSEALQIRYGEACRAYVAEHFNIRKITHALFDLYSQARPVR